jgi:hypothetical protein
MCNKVARQRNCGVQQTVCASCGARDGVVFVMGLEIEELKGNCLGDGDGEEWIV